MRENDRRRIARGIESMNNPQVTKCSSCDADIAFALSAKGKYIPIDLNTWEGEKTFDYSKHISHFATCPNAAKHRKKPEERKH